MKQSTLFAKGHVVGVLEVYHRDNRLPDLFRSTMSGLLLLPADSPTRN